MFIDQHRLSLKCQLGFFFYFFTCESVTLMKVTMYDHHRWIVLTHRIPVFAPTEPKLQLEYPAACTPHPGEPHRQSTICAPTSTSSNLPTSKLLLSLEHTHVYRNRESVATNSFQPSATDCFVPPTLCSKIETKHHNALITPENSKLKSIRQRRAILL
ncbi:hypothetical protein BX600DRAFT_27855 [Xylariales sp. PMI_506]|nr:hypothetical protein BX600DRAFT_27855 [Xylariales sp. PMI_506]